MTSPARASDAELQLVDERIVGHKPHTLDFAAAAALPLTSLTAYEALFDKLRLTADSSGTLLVLVRREASARCSSSSPSSSPTSR
ncbi:hypothetical protein [Propionibacterium freudenreichii]|uniref:hypothetical protein n=1 Tax=Propionibacterium freudenreichii TaxID=1744 RepID=UPI0021A3879F|nr:hypothetical protein [Propionibacterium freudenreichii]